MHASRILATAIIAASSVITLGSAALADDATPVPPTKPNVLGTHVVNVGMVRGARRGESPNVADVRAVVRLIDRYWSTVTDGRIRFRLGRTTFLRREQGVSPCDIAGADVVVEKLGAPVTGETQHFVVVQSEASARCGFAGIGDQPGNRVIWNWSTAWGSRHGSPAMIARNARILGHELGHNLGFGHTLGVVCVRVFRPTCHLGARAAAPRLADEYGGRDIMGLGGEALNPIAQLAAGLLPDDAVVTVNLDTPVRRVVKLREIRSKKGIRALRLVSDGREWFVSLHAAWAVSKLSVGERRGLGAGDRVPPSVRVHVPDPFDRMGAQMMSPDPDDRMQGLRVEDRYPLAHGRLTVLSIGTSVAVIRIVSDGR